MDPPSCNTLTWQEPTGNPTPIVANTVSTWAVNDQLELDGDGVSWSVIHGEADISLVSGPSFISIAGNIVTF